MTRNIDPKLGNLDDIRRIMSAYALRIGVFPSELEDVVQDAFVNMFGAYDRLDANGNIRSFAMTTVRNVFYRRLRHKRHTREAMDTIRHHTDYAAPMNAGPAMLDLERACEAMHNVLSTKEETDLTMAVLGYSTEERAAATGWSPTSVTTRTGQSRRKLIAALT